MQTGRHPLMPKDFETSESYINISAQIFAFITRYIIEGAPAMPCRRVLLNLFAQVGTSLLLKAFLQLQNMHIRAREGSRCCICWLKATTDHAHGRGLARIILKHCPRDNRSRLYNAHQCLLQDPDDCSSFQSSHSRYSKPQESGCPAYSPPGPQIGPSRPVSQRNLRPPGHGRLGCSP